MQEVGIKFLALDSNLVDQFDTLIKKAGQLAEVETTLAKGSKDLEAALALQNKEMVTSNNGLDKAIKQKKKAIKEETDYADALKNTVGEIKVFGVSLNDARGKLSQYSSNLKGLTKGLKSASIGSKVLTVSMRAIPLLALVAAFTALVSFLSSTERGANALAKVMAVFSAVTEKVIDTVNVFGEAVFNAVRDPKQAFIDLVDFIKSIPSLILDNVITRLQAVGKIVKSVINLDFKAAGAAAVDAMTGVEDSVSRLSTSVKAVSADLAETVKQAVELERAKIALRKAEIELTTSFRATRAEIKELTKEGENVNNSYDVRKQKISESFELEKGIFAQRSEIAKRNLAIIQRDIALNSDSDKIESLERVAEAQQKISEIAEESNELQTTLQNKLNALYKEEEANSKQISDARNARLQEQLDNIQKLEDAYARLNKRLVDDLNALNLTEADPLERLAIQREMSIKALEEQKTALVAAAEAIGKPINDIEANYNRLIAAANDQFDRKDFLVRVNLTPELDGNLDTTKIDFKEIPKLAVPVRELLIDVGEVTVEEDNFLTAFKDVFESIKDTFSSDEFKDLVSGVGTLFNEFAGIFTAGIDQQISEIDNLTDKRQNDIDKLNDELEEEKSLKAKGFEFNIDGKQKELDALNALQEADAKKKEELAAKAQRIQLIQDSVQQGSSLISAGANIIKGFSTIPIVGPALGVTAVIAMLGAFAKLKVDAFKATRLYTGSDRLYDDVGQIAPGESSDVPGRGDGFRIVDSKGMTRARVGGEEMLVDGATSLSHGSVIKWIKANKKKYSNVDMMNLLNGNLMPTISDRSASMSIASNGGPSTDTEGMYKVFSRASLEANDDMINKGERANRKKRKTIYSEDGTEYIVVRV